MPAISESEARALLSQQLRCEDSGGWSVTKRQPGTCKIRAGLIDKGGRATQLTVELVFRRSERRAIKRYVFTVLRRNLHDSDRVYQLEIIQASKELKDLHKRSHEHFGTTRSACPELSASWNYDEVLRYFCGRANVVFEPAPPNPLPSD